ncbi:MAG: ABC-F family ATP-binding cassette domain-containing protein [Planctomycetes bacterium]|nr:ABC-F family ATP-binding cassette domain-containing protein [Planctomycetota bacterium]
MALITLERAARFYGARAVFADVALSIAQGERVGLVGANGSGKSTLLRVLKGDLGLDQGERRARRGLVIGYLEQRAPVEGAHTAYEEALRGAETARALEAELRAVEATIEAAEDPGELAALAARHAAVLERFERAGGPGYERFVAAALAGLGLPPECWRRPLTALSSGQRVRAQLARLLQGRFDLLLLDEPTNHLDIEGIGWLADHLLRRPEALVVVSHDRWFLDRVATRILELDRGALHSAAGTFSEYVAVREQRRKTAWRAWEKQEEKIRRNEEFVRRAGHGNKPGVAQSRRKMLERLERLEKPPEPQRLNIRLPASDAGARPELLEAQRLAFAYPGQAPLFENLSVRVARGDRLGVVGANGSGKTTLLRVLAGRLAPSAGEVRRAPRAGIGYFDQELAGLDAGATLLREVQAADPELTEGQARGRLGALGFSGDEVFRTVGTLSGGEQARLELLKVIVAGGDLLVLDEPTNHLDVFTREAFLGALHAFAGAVILVTHDRHLLEAWARRVIRVAGATTVVHEGGFRELEAPRAAPCREEPRAVATRTARTKALRARAAAPSARRKRRFWKLEDLEAAIIAKEAALEAIEAAFADPAVARDGERVKRLIQERKALAAELGELNEEWEGWA